MGKRYEPARYRGADPRQETSACAGVRFEELPRESQFAPPLFVVKDAPRCGCKETQAAECSNAADVPRSDCAVDVKAQLGRRDRRIAELQEDVHRQVWENSRRREENEKLREELAESQRREGRLRGMIEAIIASDLTTLKPGHFITAEGVSMQYAATAPPATSGGKCASPAEEAELCAELDRARVQLAACGVAALGGAEKLGPEAYGWSASYGDVLKLRQEVEQLRGARVKIHKSLDAALDALRSEAEDRGGTGSRGAAAMCLLTEMITELRQGRI